MHNRSSASLIAEDLSRSDSSNPVENRRSVTTGRAIVTSPHTLASQAGMDVLRRGGNAIEAAIAMGAAIAVTYPHFCGLGGDAVWIVSDGNGNSTTFMGIGQSPSKLPEFSSQEIPSRGPASMLTTACVVDSWRHAFEYSQSNWHGRMSFASLLDAAIGYAQDGFPTTPSQIFWHDYRRDQVKSWPGFCQVFEPGGAMPAAGGSFRQPQLAETLKLIARNGARDFYEGETASKLAKGFAEAGSTITGADLKATITRQCDPLCLDYRGLKLLAPPPPTQGITTLGIMGVLREFDLSSIEEGSAEYYHLCVEAVKQAFLDRHNIADPDFYPCSPDDFLSNTILREKASRISLDRAMPWPHEYNSGDTVYLAVTDQNGHSVSILQSTYFDWGSGVVVGDTGVLWQNRGAGFSLDPSSPNRIAAGKRPFYTLNPGMALKDNKPHLLYGTQGADGQPQTLSLLLTRLIDYQMDPMTALSKPRFLLGKTFSDSQEILRVEANAGEAVLNQLAERGHEIGIIETLSPLAGQAGAIVIASDDTISGAHDPRSDGKALGM